MKKLLAIPRPSPFAKDRAISIGSTAGRLKAFTLVELLVVIGIIGLLLAVLLPTIAAARHSANTLKCAANLRSIGQAMMVYAAENHNRIIGAPVNTGGGYIVDVPGNPGWPNSYTPFARFPPAVNQVWDWETPVLNQLGVAIQYSGAELNQPAPDPNRTSAQARWDRVLFEANYALFNCPENQALATAFYYRNAQVPLGMFFTGVSGIPTSFPMPSYTVGIDFMVVHNPLLTGTSLTPSSGPPVPPTVYGNFYEDPPQQYVPRVDLVGPNSEKIFCADGGRYVLFSQSPAVISETWTTTDGEGGEYADWGADSAYTRAQNREQAPNNTKPPITNLPDERSVWARHGPIQHSKVANAYKFNAVFFDGHVETLGDLEGANPTMWMPKGTAVSPGEFWLDVYNTYSIPQGQVIYVCPR